MDLLDDFLAGYSGNTLAAYRRDLVCWQSWLDARTLDLLAVTRADVNVYARELESQGRSASTVARRLSTISGLYAYAVAEDVLERNPATYVRRPAVSRDSQTLGLSQAEAVALLAAAKASSVRDWALVAILLHTGARVSEALGLRIEDVVIDGGFRCVRLTGKGGKVRLIPVSGAVEAIDALIGARTDGYLFATRTGNAWVRADAARAVQRLAVAAGIEQADRITPHSLRHTSITASLEAGATIHDTQDFAGHADPRTTQRYNRARNSLANSPAHKLATYFGDAA